MVAELTTKPESRIVDLTLVEKIRSAILRAPRIESPVECVFTPKLMTRRIVMEPGSRQLSKIHKTEHQYFVLQGSCLVSENGGEPLLISAPFHGITKPGTWREIFVLTETIWVSVHPTTKTTVEEVEQEIIQSMEEPNNGVG